MDIILRNYTKKQIMEISDAANLSQTDTDILFLLSREFSLQEISDKLLISTATVSRKIRRIRKRISMIEN